VHTDMLPEYIRSLLRAECYPHPVGELLLIQTHISFVLLAGDYVYKWKKPVNFGFLDFSTREKRKFYCERELALNRRLCPDIYLDLVTMTTAGGVYTLGGSGEIVEYGVKMVRLPEKKMMSRIMEAGGLQNEHLQRIIDTLVLFYRQAETAGAILEFGRTAVIAATILENFDQTEVYIGGEALSREQFTRIKDYAVNFLRQESLFADRVAAGCIRDCHGDLHSGNICLAEKTHIFDCIEFNDRFRYTDVAADLAFLAMDIDFHGLPEMAERCIELYISRSGDSGIRTVLNFYKCYRAYVRGKIMLLTASDSTVSKEVTARCLNDARRYFALAEGYARC
jgi:uncharacterized protein